MLDIKRTLVLRIAVVLCMEGLGNLGFVAYSEPHREKPFFRFAVFTGNVKTHFTTAKNLLPGTAINHTAR